jgi:hypothetical protein
MHIGGVSRLPYFSVRQRHNQGSSITRLLPNSTNLQDNEHLRTSQLEPLVYSINTLDSAHHVGSRESALQPQGKSPQRLSCPLFR